ncbi:MAG TPA: hypothetical protein VF142_21360 [Longimicrobium sp.]
MLRNVTAYVLSERRPPGRTTSVIEREMREINRRTDVGARWSEPGVDRLLRATALEAERVWSAVQKPLVQLVPLN